MSDQPAAPFDVERHRVKAKETAAYPGEAIMGGWEVQQLGREMLAACDRIEELQRAVKRVSEWCQEESARAEAAEARVEELEHFVRQTDLGDIRSRCQKAEASCATLVEALQYYASSAAWTSEAVEGNNGDYGKRARAVLASPDQAGAKLLSQLAEQKLIASTLHQRACDLQEERDRLAARNEKLEAHILKLEGAPDYAQLKRDLVEFRACDEVTKP